jgi:50S ribosomal subunit-associated GTPase HflX
MDAELGSEEFIYRHAEQPGDNVKSVVLISAEKGWGLGELLRLIADLLSKRGGSSLVSKEHLG